VSEKNNKVAILDLLPYVLLRFLDLAFGIVLAVVDGLLMAIFAEW